MTQPKLGCGEVKQADLSDSSAACLMYVESSAWVLWEVMVGGSLHVIGVKVVNPIEIGIGFLVGFFLLK